MKRIRHIRPATEADIPAILPVLDAARRIMRESGNPHQWADGYPSPEPTYDVIADGCWLDDTLPYHVIHRIASFPEARGIFSDLIAWSMERDRNLRIDTHRDNRIMQHCIRKAGFRYCGIIHLANGDERLAYQMPVS